jgi:hypothetical protein
LNDPAINKAMKDAQPIPAGPERNKAWAKIDDMVIGQAPAVPYVWDKSAEVFSKDVKHVMNGYYTTADLAWVSLK